LEQAEDRRYRQEGFVQQTVNKLLLKEGADVSPMVAERSEASGDGSGDWQGLGKVRGCPDRQVEISLE
jgi:hypothetical protein